MEIELTKAELEEQLRKSLLVSSLDNTFKNFERVPGTEEAYTAFRNLALGHTNWKMLLCYGGTGNGKTHLCESAAIELHSRGRFTRVMTMARIMGILKDTFNRGEGLSLEQIISNTNGPND